MESPPVRTLSDRLLGWLLFERRFTMESTDTPDAVAARLRANLEPIVSLRQLNPFATISAFKGRIGSTGGLLRSSVRGPRALTCTLTETQSGTRLNGTLRIHGSLVVFALIYPAFFICMMAYALASDPSLRNFISVIIGTPFMLLFLRSFVRVHLWFKKGRETDFLNDLEKVIRPSTLRPQAASGPHPVSPPTPTEVFIRPRLRTPAQALPSEYDTRSSLE